MTRILALVGLVAIAASARADDTEPKASYRAVIDRVELEPASITGARLRIYLSALAIDGQRLDLTDPKSIRTYLGQSELRAPYALGTYSATSGDLAMVVLVQTTQDFSDALPAISDALEHQVVAKLGDHARIAILTYGEAAGTAKLQPAKAMIGKVGPIPPDGSLGDPALLDGLDRALAILRKADPPPTEGQPPQPLRKLVVVIGDGRDRSNDHDRVTAAGKRALKEGVRIHAVAYSPADVRRPLLLLGELSKQSLGTLRWPARGRKPTAESWDESFGQLGDEIAGQYVLTYFVDGNDDVAGKRLHVVTSGRTEATSNELKVPEVPGCSGTPCDGYCADDRCVLVQAGSSRGLVTWLIWIGGGVVGLILVLGTVGFFMQRKQRAAMAGQPVIAGGGPLPPNMLADGRWAPTLLVLTGARAGYRTYLKHGFTIGKQPNCDLVIDDGHTSSFHAQIGMDPQGNCMLFDQNSTNGTYINGVPVTQVALQNGVTIRVGSTELRFLTQ